MNVKGVAQIGSVMGNHITEKSKILKNVPQPVHAGRGYMPVGPTDNVKAVGVGGGRTVYRTGVQGQHGNANVARRVRTLCVTFSNRSKQMVEVKHSGNSMEQRIADRLKPSCDPSADIHIKQGEGPTRVHTAIHRSGAARQHGAGDPGANDIHGHKRGTV